ncbi:helix-turn-helix transcriptional regulator [Streptomyces sp. NPDC001941]|uniref:helix-turn-helix domain-containing protein n=1 Tax=Streptomyces sp. NPDC001941 TaxID=3154659 RepID=UPI00332948A0
MSTDFQQARVALGIRLRELRGRTSGRALAAQLGWTQSKVSKLETGRQTATPEDLRAWAEATGHPEAGEELLSRLQGLESRSRSWRRQLAAGHRPVQDTLTTEYERASVLYAWEGSMVVGPLQTADYARAIFESYSELHQSPRDTEAAVRARMERQRLLHDGRQAYHVVMWEAALYSRICRPGALAAQLDRLAGTIGLDTVHLGIVPFAARVPIPPGPGFWILDDRLVLVEDWHAELWLDDRDSLGVYQRVWERLAGAAVYGDAAHRLIARARAALDLA